VGAEIVYAETLTPYPRAPTQESLVRDGLFREEEGIYYFFLYRCYGVGFRGGASGITPPRSFTSL
jgi:hypothetical protein